MWDQTNTDLIEKVNAYYPTITFTAEVLQIETTFLDTKVCKGKSFESGRILDVLTHFKTTETFQCTHFKNCPPASVKKGLVKGEAFRILQSLYLRRKLKISKHDLSREAILKNEIKILSEVNYTDRKETLK